MTTTVETPTADNKLAAIAHRSGLTREAADQIAQTFVPFVAQAGEIAREAEGVVVTSVEQKKEIKLSRELRLRMRAVRVNVEKNRKDQKDESVRRGKLIDDLSNFVKGLIEPVETRLDEQEKIAERQEAERVAKIVKDRREALRPYCTEVVMAHLNNDGLAAMHEADFTALLKTYKDATEHAAETAQREAKERAEREAETARLNAENDRIAKELADEKAKADKERADAQAKVDAANAAAKAAQDKAEADRKAAQLEADRKLRAEQDKAQREREAADAKRRESEAAAKREADEKAMEAARVANAKIVAEARARRAAEAVSMEALVVLGDVDLWMTAKIGEPPADPEQWQDGHALLASVRDLLAKGGGQ